MVPTGGQIDLNLWFMFDTSASNYPNLTCTGVLLFGQVAVIVTCKVAYATKIRNMLEVRIGTFVRIN